MSARNYNSEAKFEDLKGKTITDLSGLDVGSERVSISTNDGKSYLMLYHHDCCASCSIDEIHGDPKDLCGSPILLAEEVQNFEGEKKGEHDESFTWTFYKLSTIKGSVTIKWYGTSNGFYSESASFEEVA
jgi:hypothetical protein